MAKKTEEPKTVRIEMHKPFIAPDEGEWFQVQTWREDDGPYSMLFKKETGWMNYGEAARTEFELAGTIEKAKSIYAKVRVMHTVRYAHGV